MKTKVSGVRTAISIFGALALGLIVGGSANAATFTWTWTGTNFNASGFGTAADTLDSLGGHDILSISGNVTGPVSGPITGLIPNPNQPNQALFTAPSGNSWFYDNVGYSSSPVVDTNGVLFGFGAGDFANIYSVGTAYFFSVDAPPSLYNPGDPGQLVITQTPIPGAVWLFGSALACFGWLTRRTKRSAHVSPLPA